MAKAAKNLYACGECGATAPKWQGQCPGCGAWNTLVETRPEPAATGNRFAALAGASRLQSLAEVEAREEDRLPTGIAEFDRALGGGLVAGGVILIGGDPGIGKSTLLLQALTALAETQPVLGEGTGRGGVRRIIGIMRRSTGCEETNRSDHDHEHPGQDQGLHNTTQVRRERHLLVDRREGDHSE